jgi:hypothetical protein
MPLTIIPSPVFHALEAVKLGRLITNIDQPHESYHEPQIQLPPPIVAPFFFNGQNQQGNKTSFGSALIKILSAKISKEARVSIKIAADQATSYSLDNSEVCFDEALSTPETRAWIERTALRGRHIYLIVGVQTLTNPYIDLASATSGQGEAGLHISMALAAATGGAFASVFQPGEPALEGKLIRSDVSQRRLTASGERVCALQYRRLKYRWLSFRSLKGMQLSKTRQWSCLEGDSRAIYEYDDEQVIDPEKQAGYNGDVEHDDDDDDNDDVIAVEFDKDDEPPGDWVMQDCDDGPIYTHS